MQKLESGQKILIDFDGVIAENLRPDGTYWYPEFGPPMPGIKNFLEECHRRNVIIEIWSARTNYDPEFPKENQGHFSMEAIRGYMHIHRLKFDSILLAHKPIGQHKGAARWLLDDRTLNFNHGDEYAKFLFGIA